MAQITKHGEEPEEIEVVPDDDPIFLPETQPERTPHEEPVPASPDPEHTREPV